MFPIAGLIIHRGWAVVEQLGYKSELPSAGMRTSVLPIVLVLGVASAWSFVGSSILGERINSYQTFDRWFESDIPQVYDNLTNLQSVHRTLRHPLFSLLFYPPVKALSLLGVDHISSVRILVAALAGLWSAVFAFLVRRTTGSWSTAAPFLLLFVGSAFFLFWAPVAETFVAGSISLLLALTLVACQCSSPAVSIGINILTFGTTTTNWMGGLIAAACVHRRQLAAAIAVVSLVIGTAAAAAETRLMRNDGMFFEAGKEAAWVTLRPEHILHRWRAVFSHSEVIPEPVERTLAYPPDFVHTSVILSVEERPVHLAAVLWWIIVGVGCYGFVSATGDQRYRIALGTLILGQLALHTVFGVETFVHSAHFGPLLLLVAAWSVHTRARRLVIALAWIAGLAVTYHNARVFLHAAEMLKMAA